MASKYTTEILARDQWAEWDVFVDETAQGTVFHPSEWLLAATNDADAVSFLVLRGALGAIVGGLPLVRRRVGWYVVYQPPAISRYAGLVLSEPTGTNRFKQYAEQKEKSLALLGAMPEAALIRFPLHISNSDSQPFVWHGYRASVSQTYRLEGLASAEEAWEGLDPKQRNIVRKAEKQGIEARATQDAGQLIPLIRDTFRRQGQETPQEAETYLRLWEAAKRTGRGAIYMAYAKDGTPEAGLMVVWDPRAAYLVLSGADTRRRASGAGALATWYGIKDILDRGLVFDFEGSTLPGVERFYRIWGTRLCPFINVEKIRPLVLQFLVAWRSRRAARAMVRMFAEARKE